MIEIAPKSVGTDMSNWIGQTTCVLLCVIMPIVCRAGLLVVAFMLLASRVYGADFDKITRTPIPTGIQWRIDRPTVNRPTTEYPLIVLHAGDRVIIHAGGCVQTQASAFPTHGGTTWKRYVNPLGKKADELYSATISLPGTTEGIQRLQPWLGDPFFVSTTTYLTLGYQDGKDDYGDNDYSDHDDGTDNQCLGQGPAWLTVTVEQGYVPSAISPRYNEVFQKSVHNAFEAGNPLWFFGIPKSPFEAQLSRFGVRSLEIDIHPFKSGDPAPSNDFFVYHNEKTSPESNCSPLSSCLDQLLTWHRSRPQHEVVTVFLDMNDDWETGHSEDSLDMQLRNKIGAALYTPADILNRCPGSLILRGALSKCGWPTAAAMRGKFLFVLTEVRSVGKFALAARAVANQANDPLT